MGRHDHGSAARSEVAARRRSRSTLWTIVVVTALGLSLVAASHAPTVSFDARMLGVAALLDWLMPQVP